MQCLYGYKVHLPSSDKHDFQSRKSDSSRWNPG